MAGVTLNNVPPALFLNGQELVWIYQPTGLLTTPWVGLTCTTQQLATLIGGTYIYAKLPTPTDGMRAYVTDSTVSAAGNFGSSLSGGGVNHTTVWYDGGSAIWRIG